MTTMVDNMDAERRDALIGRLFESVLGSMDLFACYLGDRLGLYEALADGGVATSDELAGRTGTHERYVREWLEQQATTGILEVENPEAAAGERRFRLPPAFQEVFLEKDSPNYFAGVIRLAIGAASPLAAVVEAYRTGAGVAYADYGPDTREGIAEMNRPMFVNQLTDWLAAMPETHARLSAEEPARVADVGCGTGWSSIAIARAYPNVRVDGFDLDAASIERAKANAAAAGVADRVTFQVRDAADPTLAGRYDLVTAFETVHDMARPVEALRVMRGLLRAGGAVLVADERVGETFQAPGSDIERLNYGFSVIHCLPATLAERGPLEQATGTVMRPPTMRRYAAEAGFGALEVLPVEHDFWWFYRLAA
jgi:SAM-dependent methyltransferase